MRKTLIKSACVLAMAGCAASAMAADISPRVNVPKAPIYMPYNWTGGYVGINGGGGWGNSDSGVPFPGPSYRVSGALVGGTLGYNWQWARPSSASKATPTGATSAAAPVAAWA